LEALSPEEIVFAARLAGRLGGVRLYRWLLHQAVRRQPDHPLVYLYGRRIIHNITNILDEFREFELRPMLNSRNPDWDARWLTQQARLWGYIGGFDKAHELINQAKELQANSPYIDCCEARILNYKGSWEEALEIAEQVWLQCPGMPSAVDILGHSLAKLGRLQEAVKYLLPVTKDGQSCDALMMTIWYMCALAERSDERERRKRAREAYDLSQKVYELAPLADREFKTGIL
jgi:predicted Zn-dependent protease